MKFTVSGVPKFPKQEQDAPVSATWNNGILSGDEDYQEAIRERARRLNGQSVGPFEGPTSSTQHLKYPISASTIMADLLLPGTVRITGDVPMREAAPKGADG